MPLSFNDHFTSIIYLLTTKCHKPAFLYKNLSWLNCMCICIDSDICIIFQNNLQAVINNEMDYCFICINICKAAFAVIEQDIVLKLP